MEMRCRTCGGKFEADLTDTCPRCYQLTGMTNEYGEEVTPEGGVHAHVDGRYDLIPPEALHAIAVVMEEGVRNGRPDDNWRKVPTHVQINHALAHIVKWMGGERGEDNLAHALTRLAMAVAVEEGI